MYIKWLQNENTCARHDFKAPFTGHFAQLTFNNDKTARLKKSF
jgi:hypothetical protein